MVILFTTGRDKEHQPALLIAYYLLASSSAVTPAMLGWQAVNTAGHTKKASTTAMTIMGSYTGGIVRTPINCPRAPFLFRDIQVS